MHRAPVWIALLVLAGTASAIDRTSQSVASKRQAAGMVVDCMKKLMSRDRQISYNEAARQCKREVSKQFEGPPPGPLVADTKP
jgi:hypothetical protein